MTAPPLPTSVPQDAWYRITTGNVNPSVADPVPDISYLQPSSTPQGMVNGFVGPFDEAIVGLGGTIIGGGQKWLMWHSDSLAVADNVNVFCPFVNVAVPGRWITFARTFRQGGGATNVVTVQDIQASTVGLVTPSSAPFIQVFVKDRVTPGATVVILPSPAATFSGQTVSVKDAQGDAGTDGITVVAPSIDGETSFVLSNNYQQVPFTWNGAEWSVT